MITQSRTPSSTICQEDQRTTQVSAENAHSCFVMIIELGQMRVFAVFSQAVFMQVRIFAQLKTTPFIIWKRTELNGVLSQRFEASMQI